MSADKFLSIEDANNIRVLERDYFLNLHGQWPSPVFEWQARPDESCLFRIIQGRERPLLETIIRFPTAPIYGIHRKYEYQSPLTRINYHTMRLLQRCSREKEQPRIRRIYVFHNGLNEIDHMGFYYTLADMLVGYDPDDASACLICPFPGHLSRYPIVSDYAEKPLDRYLGDAGDLFRQFLRFMLETQWLLSILVPVRSCRVIPGLYLLAEGDETNEGRVNSDTLANAIYKSWRRAFDANLLVNGRDPGLGVSEQDVKKTIETFRTLIGWQQPAQIDLARPPQDVLLPALHAIGYSLGGFVAQSMFFTWPYAVSSCTTLCSGGALREVAPKAFAHPEEWRTVMRLLRFEIESAMIDGRLKRSSTDGSIAGIEADTFSYFDHMFSEVFLREHLDSYQTRLSEFFARLFFVVGGNDPIIPTKSVLDASPPEGVNLLQIANLPHFLQRHEEPEWQKFWLPKVADIIASLSRRTEGVLGETLNRNWLNRDWTEYIAPHSSWPLAGSRVVSPKETSPMDPDAERRRGYKSAGIRQGRERGPTNVALNAPDFEAELGAMVDLLAKEGWLFIFRNHIPVALRGPKMVHQREVFHSQDDRIREYLEGLRAREERMLNCRRRVTLVIPEKLKEWFVRQPALLSAKGPTTHIPTPEVLTEIRDYFYSKWSGIDALREFNPNPDPSRPISHELVSSVRRKHGIPENHPVLNTLPDVWIAFSGEALREWADLLTRVDVEKRFIDTANALFESSRTPEGSPIERRMSRWLTLAGVRIVKVSAVRFNPRFMGERILIFRDVRDMVIHGALGYLHSGAV